MKVLIHHWDAVELFCLFVSEYEGRKLTEFHNYDNIGKSLDKYSDIDLAQSTSISTLKKTHTLENLVRSIRLEVPVIMTENEFGAFGNYIKKPHPVPAKKIRAHWSPKPKSSLLVGRWWLYHFEIYKKKPGIVRAVMTLKPFNKVVVDNLGPTEKKQQYIGHYEVYGDKAEYLLMELKIANVKVKNLHMLFYIGATEAPELALGQYHNEENSIYSGTLMIEPALGRGTMSPKFCTFDKMSIEKDIPKYAWDFFSVKSLNYLKVTSKITNKQQFADWWEIQQRKRRGRNDDDLNNTVNGDDSKPTA